MVAGALSSSGTSRVPASSRWIAKSRTRTRIVPTFASAAASAAEAGDEEPIAKRQDRGVEPRIAQDRRIEFAQGRRVLVRDRRIRDAAAPQDVVGDDQGARREPR